MTVDMSLKRMLLRYFRVERRDIAYFRFILDAYEGFATLSTLDAQQGLVVLSIPESQSDAVEALLAALGREISLEEVPYSGQLPFTLQQETNDHA